MFTDEIDKTQFMMRFIVVIVMRNEFGNKRKGMGCFSGKHNHQNQK